MQDVLRRIDASLPATRAQLESLIRVPSVSADPAHARDVRESAEAFAELIDGDVLTVDGAHPIVCAYVQTNVDAPTLLIYGHHDVQPAGALDRWTTPPFEPRERDGRLYGRGSADDKGGILACIAAVKAFDRLPLNVRFLIEGEEEVGSRNLARYFEKYPERIAADYVAICDTPNFDTGVPALTYRMRGNCTVDVEVRVMRQALHSGRGGGVVPDPIQVLARLISSLTTDDGRIAVPGIYDDFEELTNEEVERIRALGMTASRFRDLFGVLPSVSIPDSPLERTLLQPSLTVTALDAPPIAQASNQISASAAARISIRTVPNLENARVGTLLSNALKERAPKGVEVNVTVRGGPLWWKTNPTSSAHRAALCALTRGFGRDAVAIGSGGSIGFLGLFSKAVPDAQIFLLGVEDPPCNAHSENESLHLGDWRSLMRSVAFLIEELSR